MSFLAHRVPLASQGPAGSQAPAVAETARVDQTAGTAQARAFPQAESTRGPKQASRALCIDQASVFQHPLLENPPSSSASAAERHDYSALERQAAQTCQRCPLLAGCLYDAVVRHDVAGYAAGTTARERGKARALLGITVEPENLDTLAGVSGGNRPVDHDEVVRLRAANPDESLERLAQRLGCSLSTVKRHLRQERSGGEPARRPSRRMPSMRDVLTAARHVLDVERGRGGAAA